MISKVITAKVVIRIVIENLNNENDDDDDDNNNNN